MWCVWVKQRQATGMPKSWREDFAEWGNEGEV